MIIGSNFIFIHNPHCAGSSVRKILETTYPNSNFFKLEKWHEPIANISKENKVKIKFGFIRNPWLWYASFFEHQQPNGQFLQLFLDGKKNEFKRFLTNMLDNNFLKKHINKQFHPVGDPYTNERIPKFKYITNLDIGFLTYRYIYMFFNDYKNLFLNSNIDYITKNHDVLFGLDEIGKSEALLSDLSKIFYKIDPNMNDNIVKKWKSIPKQNGKRKYPYQDYYKNNDDLIKLVSIKDKIIVDRYGYTF